MCSVHRGCLVHQGVFNVQYMPGVHRCSAYAMSTSGDIEYIGGMIYVKEMMSTLEVFSTSEGYHDLCEGIS